MPTTIPDPNGPTILDLEQTFLDNNFGRINDNIDQLQRMSQISPSSSAYGTSFYGINHRQTPSPISINKDFYGLAFFTRPTMNMRRENIGTYRQMMALTSTNERSVQRIIRSYFDYRLFLEQGIACPFVNPNQAFIAPLTNHLQSMNGWPDIVAQTFTSHEGAHKESYGFLDGNLAADYQNFDLSCTFRNLTGDPITTLFYYWLRYMEGVFMDELVPYMNHVFNNEIDYQTRIYRVILDSTKTVVQKIAATGISFPENSPLGAAFDFDARSEPINRGNDQITINFKCFGATYLDDILVDEFNRTVQLFQPLMRPDRRASYFTKIPMGALSVFNCDGYPNINPDTYELEWYIETSIWQYWFPVVQSKASFDQDLITGMYPTR